ncbi:aminotransferase class III-fold pyridoxal phosphate-dependent enzyme [Rhodopirellula europaea]|nr:aminotransferase class III-fold pyridoxal phosphate-dependent enzyme [Rhodopirellula europaea]
MTTTAIIQARVGSTRFPAKVLKSLRGQSLIGWVSARVGSVKAIDQVVWVIPTGIADDELERELKKLGQIVVRGSEEDVLSRYLLAATEYPSDTYVRLTADNPLIPGDVIDDAVTQFHAAGVDYLATTYPISRIPDGFDVEVFSRDALLRANQRAYLPSDREHVTKHIWSNPQAFRLGSFQSSCPDDLSTLRFAVDTPEDLEATELLAAEPTPETMKSAVERYQSIEPDVEAIRGRAEINAGLATSKQTDLEKLLKNPGDYTISDQLLQRSKNVIPGATQTFSKGYTQFAAGATPLFINRAKDCFVWDVDGNAFVDYIMGIGPVLLGHSYDVVDQKVQSQIERLLCPSISSELEVEVAERLASLSPWDAPMVRFAKNGSDATTGAIRVARAFTNRERVICGGYHGWHDWYIGSTSRSRGVPQSTIDLTTALNVFDFDQLEAELASDDVAAVIFEPMSSMVPSQEQIDRLFELCHKHGTLVIFDECWTGFRVHDFGACSFYNVQPDLACFGKGCANGYPISFLIGKPEIMEMFAEVFFSFTFAGDALGLSAINAVLDVLQECPAHPILEKRGQKLWNGIESLVQKHSVSESFGVIGYAQKPLLQVKTNETRNLIRTFFNEHFASNGILFGGYHVLSTSHTEAVIDYTLAVYDSFFEIVANCDSPEALHGKIRGRVVEDVFRQH